LHCTASVALEVQFPDAGSQYAAAGTLAHRIAELKARRYFLEPENGKNLAALLKALKSDPDYSPDMEEATDAYLEYLQEQAMGLSSPPFVALESRVDVSAYAPGCWGTADCIMVGDGILSINDYKNGSGVPVEAKENPQLSLYALGALETYGVIFGDIIQRVRLSIIQPHAGGVKVWETDRDALEQWGRDVVRPAARQIASGDTGFDPSPARCRFCRARHRCRARAEQLLALAEYKDRPAELLSDTEVGDILQRGQSLAKWVEDVKEYALSAAIAGREIPGYKVVAGRSARSWCDMDQAFSVLQSRGVPEALLWERKPVTVAGLEKAMGKKPFTSAAEGLVVTKPGAPALVPTEDKRPAWNAAQAAFQEVSTDG
jgi:hypothetical protein